MNEYFIYGLIILLFALFLSSFLFKRYIIVAKKYNLYTPGTKIKIISEKLSRKMNPKYYLVLPWHFKNEILKRENKIRKKGTKFIFPLPQLKVL